MAKNEFLFNFLFRIFKVIGAEKLFIAIQISLWYNEANKTAEADIMEKLRILSNNIWWTGANSPKWEARGEDCSPQHRSIGLAKTYAELEPDIIGLQESAAVLTDNVTLQLKKATQIPYALLWGRDTPILYRTDKFDLVDSYFDVYPEEVLGFEGSFNNLNTKSYCIAVLKSKQTGKLLIFATTHVWYMLESQQTGSNTARKYQLGIAMAKIEDFIKKYNCPAILVGDFNAYYNSDEVQSVVQNGYTQAYFLATQHRDETCGYHICNGDRYEGFEDKKTFYEAIDQFFLKGFEDGAVKNFDRHYPEYYYPLSDHFPLYIDMEF